MWLVIKPNKKVKKLSRNMRNDLPTVPEIVDIDKAKDTTSLRNFNSIKTNCIIKKWQMTEIDIYQKYSQKWSTGRWIMPIIINHQENEN